MNNPPAREIARAGKWLWEVLGALAEFSRYIGGTVYIDMIEKGGSIRTVTVFRQAVGGYICYDTNGIWQILTGGKEFFLDKNDPPDQVGLRRVTAAVSARSERAQG